MLFDLCKVPVQHMILSNHTLYNLSKFHGSFDFDIFINNSGPFLFESAPFGNLIEFVIELIVIKIKPFLINLWSSQLELMLVFTQLNIFVVTVHLSQELTFLGLLFLFGFLNDFFFLLLFLFFEVFNCFLLPQTMCLDIYFWSLNDFL